MMRRKAIENNRGRVGKKGKGNASFEWYLLPVSLVNKDR